ncbi:MAG: hypothetical protein ACYC5O_16765 [Anaerolineae bacterium]
MAEWWSGDAEATAGSMLRAWLQSASAPASFEGHPLPGALFALDGRLLALNGAAIIGSINLAAVDRVHSLWRRAAADGLGA